LDNEAFKQGRHPALLELQIVNNSTDLACIEATHVLGVPQTVCET
jgi:hypothetical protein